MDWSTNKKGEWDINVISSNGKGIMINIITQWVRKLFYDCAIWCQFYIHLPLLNESTTIGSHIMLRYKNFLTIKMTLISFQHFHFTTPRKIYTNEIFSITVFYLSPPLPLLASVHNVCYISTDVFVTFLHTSHTAATVVCLTINSFIYMIISYCDSLMVSLSSLRVLWHTYY